MRFKKLRIAWAKSRSACCCTVCDPAASHSFGARSGQLRALLVVARGVAAVLPVLLLLDG
ncbi:MAG: hypothetical protein WCB92_00905 [Mycobacterium sp.]